MPRAYNANGGIQQSPIVGSDSAEHLPELRSTYHDSFGGSGGFMYPSYKPGSQPGNMSGNQHGKQVQVRSPVPPSPRHAVDTTRLNYLEDRLNSQERASQNLLDRATRIKEDVIENLNLTHSTWQGEKKQRELLQEHIKSITELVRKLDRDIKALEEQIRVKDSYIASSGNAIKSIELQQATTVTDIRGRIARCDAAILKLANDHQSAQSSLKQMGSKQQESFQKLQDKIQAIEIKIAESTQKFERSNTESLLRTQSKEGDTARNTAVMETKLKASIDELRLLMNNQKHVADTEREKAVDRLNLELQQQDGSTKDKLDKLEKRVDHALRDLNTELKEIRSASSVKDLVKKQQEMEEKVRAVVEASLRQQLEKFNKLKNECRLGFSSVHESITNSKSVLEGKLTLSEEQLRKEIGHIKQMVVLV